MNETTTTAFGTWQQAREWPERRLVAQGKFDGTAAAVSMSL